MRNLSKTFYLQEDWDRVFVSLLANLMVGSLWPTLSVDDEAVYFRCSHAFWTSKEHLIHPFFIEVVLVWLAVFFTILKGGPLRTHLATQIYAAYFRFLAILKGCLEKTLLLVRAYATYFRFLVILKGAPLRSHLATQIYAAYFRCSHAFCCWLPKSTSYIPSSLR